jgi:hypothetical protein
MLTFLSGWRHSGFHVYCGKRILPKDETALENLARYIIRASFSQERMRYRAGEGTVIYTAKDGNDRKVFAAEEWLVAMWSHVPNWGEQMVRYYGWYSNVLRGKRLKGAADDAIPCLISSDRAPAACRKSWARLIKKIYEADPLLCPKCQGPMRIISFIEDQEVIQTILRHLGFWDCRSRPPAKAHTPPAAAADGTLLPHDTPIYGDPIYPWEAYL